MPRLTSRLVALSAAALSVAVTATLTGPASPATALLPSAPTLTAKRVDGIPTEFRISSFNVLGSSHTAGRGSHARMAPGPTRIRRAVRFIDHHAFDVIGFQELQMDQFDAFIAATDGRFGISPGGVDRRSVQNSIAWRLSKWRLVEGQAKTVEIPYFGGKKWDMPYVLLQNVESGQQAYFMNFHNPATNRRHRGNQKWRTKATKIETTLANSLARETGLPVFITGDMNEREEYFCALTAGAPMKAANGGRNRHGVCTPPPMPMPVDWIFGTRGRAKFSNWMRDDRAKGRITDHYVVHADVRIRPQAVTELTPVTP